MAKLARLPEHMGQQLWYLLKDSPPDQAIRISRLRVGDGTADDLEFAAKLYDKIGCADYAQEIRDMKQTLHDDEVDEALSRCLPV